MMVTMPVRSMLQVLLPLLATASSLTAQSVRPKPAHIAGAVDSLAMRAMALELTPALGVAITMDGRTVYQRAFGAVDVTAGIAATDQTLWYLASTSKSLTAQDTAARCIDRFAASRCRMASGGAPGLTHARRFSGAYAPPERQRGCDVGGVHG